MSLALFEQILTVMIAKKSKIPIAIGKNEKFHVSDEKRRAFFQLSILLIGSLFLLIIEYSSANGESEMSDPIHDEVMGVSENHL